MTSFNPELIDEELSLGELSDISGSWIWVVYGVAAGTAVGGTAAYYVYKSYTKTTKKINEAMK